MEAAKWPGAANDALTALIADSEALRTWQLEDLLDARSAATARVWWKRWTLCG